MKLKWLIVCALTLALVGVAAWQGAYRVCCAMSGEPTDASAWLAKTFDLNAETLVRIAELQRRHAQRCEEHCRQYRELDAQIKQAAPQAQADLIAKREQVDRLCRASIVEHVHEVALLMGQEKGPRYEKLVLARLTDFDHKAAPDLALKPEHACESCTR